MAQMDVSAAMAGSVKELIVPLETAVAEGDEVLVIESMKMEIPVESPAAGRVTVYFVAAGDRIEEGQALFRLEA